MRTVQFTPERGDRPDAPNVAVVITDATSNKDQNLTIPEALAAQAAGVAVFTFGFTNEMKVRKREILKIENGLPLTDQRGRGH